jgi:LysW-gamma-L-lysine carboxypeptidase
MEEIALLEELLQIYSPTGQESEAVACLVEHMRAAGFDASVDEVGNAVGAMGDGPVTVMLLGHIDTVPGFIPVRREGDTLTGRGAVDAKGPLACFVAATARARAAARLAERRIIVVGAVAEEGDSRGAQYIRDRHRPAFTIIGEPSGWERITLGYKGSAWFEYRVRRALAHTAARNESACEAAVAFWNQVAAWAVERNAGTPRVFEQVSPTLREMRSGSDGFVEDATLRFGVRLPPGVSVEALHAALRSLLDEAELSLRDGVPAYRGEKNTPLVRAFLAAIRGAGGTPTFTLKSGTSDMNIVAPVWGTPSVAYGPGDSSLDHTPDEHISLSEYQRAIGVLAEVLSGLDTSAS